MVMVFSSSSSTLSIWEKSKIMPPSTGTVEPTRLVPAPLGVTGMSCLYAYFRILLTSSVLCGKTSADASPFSLPNVSLKYFSGMSCATMRFLSGIISFNFFRSFSLSILTPSYFTVSAPGGNFHPWFCRMRQTVPVLFRLSQAL